MTKQTGESIRTAAPHTIESDRLGARTLDESSAIAGDGWEVAAPLSADGSAQQATYSETAADFFDLVFVTVALVTYTAQQFAPNAPQTRQHRAAAHSNFIVRHADRSQEMRRAASSQTLRFSRPAADTASVAEPVTLSRLSASTPQDLPALDSRLSALDSHRPTGPPVLPHISIRGWTSQYA